MIDQKKLEHLSHNDDFVAFLEAIYQARESMIGQFHDRTDSQIQQIAGRILAFDEVLNWGQWDKIKARPSQQ